ncbi:MAG: aminodeoxychorismate/anthranilate synthase component II [Thermodesulfobacteriota bacterium]|nr:aminodeoxychorismate/anthranilate synthase component II [Thermodesulfobacteriota bacterium]
MILIIDNYDSFTYNLVQAFGGFGEELEVFRNDQVSLDHIRTLSVDRLVISPGPGVPARAGISLSVIRHFAGRVPILGVCLGHQAIGEAFGGRIVPAERLMHGKVSAVYHDSKGCYRDVKHPFKATRYHSLVVDRPSLPECLDVVSETEQGEIMGIRHRELAIEGVQFHPESFLTQEGEKILSNFLRQ